MGLFDSNMSTTSSTSVSQLPDWYMNAQKGVAQAGVNVANRGYSPYPGARVASPSGDTTAAYNLTRGNVGNWQPLLSQSSGAIDQALGKSAAGAASPYLDKASQTVPGVIGSYMSPYTSNVVDRIGQLGARNLTENILPGINQTFVGGGSFGGKRNAEFVNRAIRDTQEATAAEQAKALESGYAQAGQLAQQDLSRLGQLGQTVGNLTSADVSALLQGAGQRAQNASQLQGQGLKDSAALQAIGQQQEAQSQKSLDLGYQDFLNQRDWDKGNVEWLSGILGGQRLPQSSTSTSSTPTASDGQQLLGGLTALAGLPWDDIGSWLGFKRGGPVRKYARGGLVDSFPEDQTLDALPLGGDSYGVPGGGRMEGDFGPLDDEQLKRMLASPDPYLRQMAQKELLKRQSQPLVGGAEVTELVGNAGEDDLGNEEVVVEDEEIEEPAPLSSPVARPRAPAAAPVAGPLSSMGGSDTAASMQGALEAFSKPSEAQTRSRDAVRQALAQPKGNWADNPVLQAGLSMMSNRRPDLLGAVGEGIGAAANASRGRADAERERLLKLASAELGFADKDSERTLMAARLLKPTAAKDTRTALQKDYEVAQQGGFKGSFLDYVKEVKAAGRNVTNTTVNMPGDKKLYETLNEETAKEAMANASKARSAVSSLSSLATAKDLLDKGVITGTGANFRLAADKALATAGLIDGEKVANTEAFFANVGRQTLDLVKGLGSGSGISNADREYAERVAGGNIGLSEAGLRRIIAINERAAKATVEGHNKSISALLKDPQLGEAVKDRLRVDLPGAVPAGGGARVPTLQEIAAERARRKGAQ